MLCTFCTLRKTETFLHRFTANITRCLQLFRVFFACCDVVHLLHNFLEPIIHIILFFKILFNFIIACLKLCKGCTITKLLENNF